VYDALFDDVPEAQRTTAQATAAALCGKCPNPCGDKVTADTGARHLELLPIGWMPPSSEGIPEPEQPAFGKTRRRQHDPGIGQDYVPTDKRVKAWARMAAERAAQGWTLADIALDLCVSEDTAQRLLAITHQLAA
jgi:hypothetical protein